MRYKKGESGNPNGKPKGAVNKITRDMKELHEKIIVAIQKEVGIENIIMKCKPDTVLSYIAKVMPKDMNITLTKSPKELLDELITKYTMDELLELLNDNNKTKTDKNGN